MRLLLPLLFLAIPAPAGIGLIFFQAVGMMLYSEFRMRKTLITHWQFSFFAQHYLHRAKDFSAFHTALTAKGMGSMRSHEGTEPGQMT